MPLKVNIAGGGLKCIRDCLCLRHHSYDTQMHFASRIYELLNRIPPMRETVEKSSYDSFAYNGSLSRQIRVSCPDDVGVVSLDYAWLTVLWGRAEPMHFPVTTGVWFYHPLLPQTGAKHYPTFDANRYADGRRGKKGVVRQAKFFLTGKWILYTIFEKMSSGSTVYR